jgi:predicted acylesterase/phospholipase RssA
MAFGKTFADLSGRMQVLHRAMGFWRPRPQPRYALALAGGGVIGGMYEVGALAALEERLNGSGRGFDIYVGCSAGSVVASLLAGGVRASEIYHILDNDLDDPINFRRNAVFAGDAFRRACGRFGRLVWAVGKSAIRGRGGCIPDLLAAAERDMPPGFFSLEALERYLRAAYASRGLANAFSERPRTLLIPAIDLDTAERVVFGAGELRDVGISHAVAASSAIPGFFDPYTIGGRDYVDGGVGFSGHADLAAEAGADVVFVVNPLVPNLHDGSVSMRARGMYTIMEQAGRIYSQNLLTLGLSVLSVKYPQTSFFLLQPPRTSSLLFGPSMGFEASRKALRYGYESTKEWLGEQGAQLVRRLAIAVA